MRELRVGLVGAGGVGARHATTLGALDGVRLTTVTDVDPGRARALAADHDAAVVPDLAALLATPGLDAVWLCVPPFAHGDPELAVLEAGLPFFVEKPLGTDTAVAERVAAAVAAGGLVTATGYHWRYMPGVERAAAALAGTPVALADATWWDKVPPVSWWPDPLRSGGQLVEQATHLLDVLRVLVGEPVQVSALPASVPGRAPGLVDAATAATIRFDTGAVATLSATSLLARKAAAAVTLIAAGRTVVVGETETVLSDGDRVETVPDDGIAKRLVDQAFCDAVRSGDSSGVRTPYAEALLTHRVGCALAESARIGRPVDVAATR